MNEFVWTLNKFSFEYKTFLMFSSNFSPHIFFLLFVSFSFRLDGGSDISDGLFAFVGLRSTSCKKVFPSFYFMLRKKKKICQNLWIYSDRMKLQVIQDNLLSFIWLTNFHWKKKRQQIFLIFQLILSQLLSHHIFAIFTIFPSSLIRL